MTPCLQYFNEKFVEFAEILNKNTVGNKIWDEIARDNVVLTIQKVNVSLKYHGAARTIEDIVDQVSEAYDQRILGTSPLV